MPPIVEIAVDSVADALAAQRAGAHRLEFCSDLASHGLSASPAHIAEFRCTSSLPVAAMVRPRSGNFIPSPSDHFLAPRQAEALLAAGADAIVFGFTHPDGSVHEELTARLVDIATPAHAVVHRAFDLAPDPRRALEKLVKLGVRRVLTAGMSPAASSIALGLAPHADRAPETMEERLERIRSYVAFAKGAIEVLPCGGVRADNAARFLDVSGGSQIHSACRSPGAKGLDEQQVRRLVQAIAP